MEHAHRFFARQRRAQGHGREVRDELEFVELKAAKKYVREAGRPFKTKTAKEANRAKHKALHRARGWKFRSLDWSNKECALVGDFLWNCLSAMDCFDIDER